MNADRRNGIGVTRKCQNVRPDPNLNVRPDPNLTPILDPKFKFKLVSSKPFSLESIAEAEANLGASKLQACS